MFSIASIFYYYLVKKKDIKKIDKSEKYEHKEKLDKYYKLLDKDISSISKYKKYEKMITKKIDALDKTNTPDTIHILNNKDLYYEYKGYRYLSTFPKKWIEKIDKYDNIGLDCLQCLHYCCIKKQGQLPLFLGFCEGCYKHFIVNTSYSDDCNDCDDCESIDECAYCESNDKCITNSIDFSNEIIQTLHYYKNDKKILTNLILKLNNEYGNLNVV
jgi:hypothetical protein